MLTARLLIASFVGLGCGSKDVSPPPSRATVAAPSTVAVPSAAAPSAAEPRSVEALRDALTAYRDRASSGTLPGAGEDGFLQPPTTAEISWIRDRRVPLAQRMPQALELYELTKDVLKAYADADRAAAQRDPANARDAAGSLRWSESTIRQFGLIMAITIDEVLPTLSPSDPRDQVRLDGFRQMGDGAVGMLQGSLITLRARRAELAERRALADAWREHGGTFARAWRQAQCDQLRTWVREVNADEADAAIGDALRRMERAITRCAPAASPEGRER